MDWLKRGATMVASRSVDLSARGPSAVFGKDCNPPESCINCIRASALGAELTDEQLHTLRDVVEVHMLSKGEILISEGECDDHLYAIASGELEICRASDRGREISLQRLGPGSLTGELGFLEGLKRTATVRAKQDVCIVSLHRDRLEGLLAVDPWLAYRIMRAVVRSAHGTVGNLDTAYADFVRFVSG